MWETPFLVLSGGTTLYLALLGGRKLLRAWQDAAVSCGLQVVETSVGWYPRLKARTGPVEVWIKFGVSGAQIVVEAPGPPEFRWVALYPQRPATYPGPEIKVGDQRFDDMFVLEGSPRLVLARFDAETRGLLSRLSSEGRLEISNGQLRLAATSDKVPHVLPLLVDLGRRFAQPLDIPRRLAENAQQDPEPGVRLQNLLLLIREFPDAPRIGEVLGKACSDPSPKIRLRAAKELGGDRLDLLLKLAEGLQDDTVSAEAVSMLDRRLPFERAQALLDRALSRGRIRTVRACLVALGHSGTAAVVDTLAGVLVLENIELATAAAQALGMTGSPAAEPLLIQALQREPADLRVAAADALARVGSAEAVLPLQAAAAGLLPRKLVRAARQAVVEIQSRLQGASPGQLSLAGAEAGQLSLAQGEKGELSLADDPAGRLSPADEET